MSEDTKKYSYTVFRGISRNTRKPETWSWCTSNKPQTFLNIAKSKEHQQDCPYHDYEILSVLAIEKEDYDKYKMLCWVDHKDNSKPFELFGVNAKYENN